MGFVDDFLDGVRKIPCDPKRKEYQFENYVENLFDSRYFALIEKTYPYTTNQGRSIDNSENFDFIWRYKPTNKEFAVEARFCPHLTKESMLQVCRTDQLQRYKNFAFMNGIPYFIVVGLAGEGHNPSTMFSIPLQELTYPAIYPSVFKNFERDPRSKFVWKDDLLK